jgi:hypothetical protein
MTVRQDQQRIDWERVVVRKQREAWDWLNRNLDQSERGNVSPESDGLGLRVAIQSIRAEELLRGLHRDVFSPGFEMPITRAENGSIRSAWFGYSEPLNLSRHYIPL